MFSEYVCIRVRRVEKETWLAKTRTDVLSLLLGDSCTGLLFKYISNVTVAKNGILLPKLFWPTVRKNCSSDWEKLLKFEVEDWEFS